MNFGDYFTTKGLNEDELERQFELEVYFGSPGINNATFKITVKNSLTKRCKKISFTEREVFTIDVDKEKIEEPNLLELKSFLIQIEEYFETTFNTNNLNGDSAYLSVTKGINRKRIEQWIKSKFEI